MILCDASPLVALVNKADPDHRSCLNVLPNLTGKLVTTYPCFTEAMYLLGRYGGWSAQQQLWEYIADDILEILPQGKAELVRMNTLMEQYRDRPMDLTDASLVVAAETLNQTLVFTLDSDFYVYRLKDGQSFEVIPG